MLFGGLAVSFLSASIALTGSRPTAAAGPVVQSPAAKDPADQAQDMEQAGSKLVKPSLISDAASVAVGDEVWLAVAFDIEKGWHTYWRNAGESGLPPSFEFKVEPEGALEIGEAQWAAPKRHVAGGEILDFVYEGRVLHLFRAKVTDQAKAATVITVKSEVSWLVCKEACLPGHGDAVLSLAVGTPATSGVASEVQGAVAALPASPKGQVSWSWNESELRISSPLHAPPRMAFFPLETDGNVAPTNLLKGGESLGMLRLKFDPEDIKKGSKIGGVVTVTNGRGVNQYLLEIRPGESSE